MGAVPPGGGSVGTVPPGPVIAAIDLGTNNCRLLVARPQGTRFRIIDSFSRIVRLGEGVAASGSLGDDAMARTIEALGVCAEKMRFRGVGRVRSVATQACRQTDNADAFIERVSAETGIHLECISADEEARLTLAGCTQLLDRRHEHALVFDVGGGSTEIMWVKQSPEAPPRILDLLSIPFGVVNFAERYGSGAVADGDYAAILDRVDQRLAPFDERHHISDHVARDRVRLLGTAGTVTTLAAVHLDLPRYQRSRIDGLEMDIGDARAVCRRLKEMDFEARARHPCIGRGRADLVIMGCAILEAISRRWPVPKLLIADRGVREGLLMDLLGDGGPPGPPVAGNGDPRTEARPV